MIALSDFESRYDRFIAIEEEGVSDRHFKRVGKIYSITYTQRIEWQMPAAPFVQISFTASVIQVQYTEHAYDREYILWIYIYLYSCRYGAFLSHLSLAL